FFPAGVNNTTMGMNSKAAELAKRFLPKSVTTPFVKEGSWAVAGGADLDGILLPGQQAGNDIAFWVVPPDDEEMLKYWRREIDMFLAAGVTLGKQHMAVPFFNALRELWERGELKMRFRMPAILIPQISGHTVELPAGENAEAFFRRWANLSHLGDNMLRIVGLRIPAVGGNVMGGDAWMLTPKVRPYPDRWGNASPYGGRIQEQEAVEKGLKDTFRGRDVLIWATRFGWDVSCDHCIGDRAIREVVKAWEEAKQNMIVNRRNQRLTTNHTPMAHPDDIKRMAALKIWSSISTGHSFGGGRQSKDLEAGLWWGGTEQVNSWSPVKSYIEAGSHPSLEGTMWDWGPRRGIEGEGYSGRSAFFWVGKAVTRKDEKYNRVWNPKEALSREEALWAATLWSAEQLAEDHEMGSIEVGKEADLLIIDRDYMTIPTDEIQKIQVLLTMVGGKVVFEREGAL
ncbi:MAG TPA: amidohydrolase family protein, partial [Chthonomonadales bacterium]|nr:amidohydrolase family protein [Chthonomonadales bacterium]